MSTSAPANYRFLPSHEWHDLQGDTVTIGITQFAADELTDITYVALPKVGAKLAANKRFGDIESVKTSSELFSGVTGVVTAINDALTSNPGLVNSDPYKAGWMIKVNVDNPAELQKLLSAEEYAKKTAH
jgi:glycine cleavage system H protein